MQILSKVPTSAFFDYLGPLSKWIFSTYRQNLQKSLFSILEAVVRFYVLIFELRIFSGLRRMAIRFASPPFPKSVSLACCIFVGWPFVACYTCSIVFFLLLIFKLLIASNAVGFYWQLVDQ